MSAMISYVLTGFFATAFISLWFAVVYHVLSKKQGEVVAINRQLQIHYSIYRQERGGPKGDAAKRMLETSRMIYRESLHDFNMVYAKPMNRIPGFVMGFGFLKEEES